MFFQIRAILLWPRNPAFKPRRLRFDLGKVNVISGASRTGKSAVIPIIDYCLGASTCSIPVNTIRKHCEWFGVIVATDQGDKLLARREPGAQRNTDDMFLMEADTIIDSPQRIVKNTNADAVKRLLDDLAALSKLDFTGGEESTGFDGRPSFRDLAAFTFQPQNIVANPDVLFFKTNTYEHREKLRKIFPYVLGAVTPGLMAKQFDLQRTKSELRRKERELKEAQDVSARWLADLSAKFSEAQELGLTPKPEQPPTRGQMIELLEEVVARTDLTITVSTATISEALSELTDLEGEEREVSRELTTLRHRLEEMNRMRVGGDHYHHVSPAFAGDLCSYHAREPPLMDDFRPGLYELAFARTDEPRRHGAKHPISRQRKLCGSDPKSHRDATLHVSDAIADLRAILQLAGGTIR